MPAAGRKLRPRTTCTTLAAQHTEPSTNQHAPAPESARAKPSGCAAVLPADSPTGTIIAPKSATSSASKNITAPIRGGPWLRYRKKSIPRPAQNQNGSAANGHSSARQVSRSANPGGNQLYGQVCLDVATSAHIPGIFVSQTNWQALTFQCSLSGAAVLPASSPSSRATAVAG